MKIAVILNSLSPAGTNIATKDFVDELIKSHNCKVDIYTLKAFSKGDLIFENVKKLNFFSVIPFDKYDVIYSCTLKSDVYVFLTKKFFIKNRKVKFVSTMHNVIEEDLFYDYGLLISKIFSRFWLFLKFDNDELVVSSESMMKYYQRYVNKNKMTLIEYGRSEKSLTNFEVQNNDRERILKLKEKYKIVGTIGVFSKRKNYALVAELLVKYKDLCWVNLGSGEEEENIKHIVKSEGLENRVLFLGNRPDSRPYYIFFDVFFHPSRSEGFALVLIDAMSNKTPILLARLSIYQSILKDDMVSYFDLDNNDSLFEAFDRIMQDRCFTEMCIEKAYETYLKRFSISVYGQKYFNLFKF
ncbi:glycosyltransferase family 4 protein [Schleiferiaceae bacterium]|nr:glycosyltransferase family 4 protein [Schleiferiaceae bacterium]